MKTSFRFQAVTLTLLFSALSVHAEQTIVAGPLEQKVLDAYQLGDNLDDCELTLAQKNIRLKLARALDEREQEFSDYLRATARAGRYSVTQPGLKIGPLSLTSRADAPKPSDEKKPTANGWVSYTSGWEDFDKEYQAIRTQHVNARWIRLLGLVRATIADDYRRGVLGTWMNVSAEGVEEAPSFAKAIGECLNDQKCDGLQKSDSFKHALNLSPNSAADFSAYRNATTEGAKARTLKNLLDDIKPFVTYYEPVKQRGVRLSDSNTLIISLDAGDFRGYETDLGLVIEKFWKLGENSLKVEWMTSTRDEPLFKFYFLPTPKSGSQIDYVRRTITIGQNAVESIPAHEIGRAMGFRARYFSVWHRDSCKYEDQSKPEDLLSDGRMGSVSSAHWDSLKKTYAPKP